MMPPQTERYLDLARRGKNAWWRYVLGVITIAFFWLVLGYVPYLVLVGAGVSDHLLEYLAVNFSIFMMLAGLVLGGAISAVLGGGWEPIWALGMFDRAVAFGPAGKLVWMFVGGLFIGFGTRLAGGCTSGHGIFGLANFESPSLLTTLSFMAAGVATTQIIYRVIFPLVGAP